MRARLLAVLAVLGGLAGLTVAFVLAGPPAPGVAGPGQPDRADHVVVVGVTGLRWSDVDPARTPVLARLAEAGSVGALSVRAAPTVTCAGEGWLTLGAGRSASVIPPQDLYPPAGCAPRLPPPVRSVGTGATIPAMPALTALNGPLQQGAVPGELGARVPCAAAVGPGAALAVAGPAGPAGTGGHVARYAPALPTGPGQLASLLAACPLSAVDLGALPDDPGTARRQRLAAVDGAVARIDAARPAGSVLLVAGVAESGDGPGGYQARLHVAIASGPGYGGAGHHAGQQGGWLRSPSTGRTPYLQLVDVTPTVLAILGRPVPEDLAGQPWLRAGGRPDSFAATRRALTDADQAAVARTHVVVPILVSYGILAIAVVTGLGAEAVLARRRRIPRWLAVGSASGPLALAAFPVATFAANLVPWWRAGPSSAAFGVLGALVLAGMTAVTGLAWLPPWGRGTAGRAAAVCAVTVAVLLGDVLTGGRLQLNSVLGYTALGAGRFVGFGNIAFGVLGTAALLLAALLAQRHPGRLGVAIVAAVAVPVVVVEGVPGLGTDVGGVLTLVPAFGALLLFVAGIRLTTGRALAVLGAGAAAVIALAIGDYFRPADERTHFGRFVASVLEGGPEGGAATTIGRKLRVNADLLLAGPHTVALAVALVAAGVMVFRPPAALRVAYAAQPGLRSGLRVVVVLAALGCATNDAGIAIPLNAALVALPLAVAFCLRPGAGPPVVAAAPPPVIVAPVAPVSGGSAADIPTRGAGTGANVLP